MENQVSFEENIKISIVNGDLLSVKRLIRNKKTFDNSLITLAEENGHVEIAKYLTDTKKKILISEIMKNAFKSNQLHVVKRFVQN